MPKTSSNDQISAACEEIAKALNNPKLREAFLNGNKENEILNEIVDIVDRKTVRQPRVSPSSNTKKITHVPAKVEQSSHSPNTHKIKHTPSKETSGKQKPVKVKIPEPLTIFPHDTFIYKLFDKNIGEQQYLDITHTEDTTQYGTTTTMTRNSHRRR